MDRVQDIPNGQGAQSIPRNMEIATPTTPNPSKQEYEYEHEHEYEYEYEYEYAQSHTRAIRHRQTESDLGIDTSMYWGNRPAP